MKNFYILLIIFSISFGSLSFISTTNDNSLVNFSVSQISIDQKVNKLLLAEERVYTLPYTKDELRFEIIPEITAQRLELAPNYPQTDNIYGEDKKTLIRNWIINFPLEYDSYIMYIEKYIRSHK